jgi:hypothetical protein
MKLLIANPHITKFSFNIIDHTTHIYYFTSCLTYIIIYCIRHVVENNNPKVSRKYKLVPDYEIWPETVSNKKRFCKKHERKHDSAINLHVLIAWRECSILAFRRFIWMQNCVWLHIMHGDMRTHQSYHLLMLGHQSPSCISNKRVFREVR